MVGQIVDGKYQIVSFVGVGGTGRVYKANHIDLNRIIALKFLKSSDRVDLQRFRREAVSISQLRHRFIAAVYSLSISTDGTPYLAMEYLGGRSLQAAIDEGLQPGDAVRIVSQIAEGLSAAHAQGIVHRDVKPGNVVLVEDGQEQIPKVLDFGMARLTLNSSEQALTQTGEVFGTRQYISPEQYKGVAADHRADIFSLGMLLHEAVVKEGKVPEPLRPILEKALATEPADRYQSMDLLNEHLRKVTIEPSSCKYVLLSSEWVEGRQSFWNWYLLSICLGLLCLAIAVVLFVKQTIRSATKQVEPTVSIVRSSHHLPVATAALQIKVDALLTDGRPEEAEKLCNQWIERHKGSQPLPPEELLQLTIRRARCATNLKRYDDALPMWQTIDAYLTAHQNTHQRDLINSRRELSQLLRQMHQNEKAEQVLLESLEMARRAYNSELLELDVMKDLALTYADKGEASRAEAQYKLCIEKASKSNLAELGSCQANLGSLYRKLGRMREAEEYLAEALHTYERIKEPPPLLLAEAERELGQTYIARKRYKEAIAHLTNSWSIFSGTRKGAENLIITGELLQTACTENGVAMPADISAKWRRLREDKKQLAI